MGSWLGLVVEVLVASLLLVTIGYCVLVNRKLELIRSDQSELRQIVRELNAATAQAESAIAGLRETARDAEGALMQRVDAAHSLANELGGEMSRAAALVDRLTDLTQAARAAAARAPEPERAARPVRASAVGLGLLNARHRARDGAGETRGAA
jgi:methyl-accepting chemotaxis protein